MKEVKLTRPAACDICGGLAHYDVPTKAGPWAYLCEAHFEQHSAVTKESKLGSKLINPTACIK